MAGTEIKKLLKGTEALAELKRLTADPDPSVQEEAKIAYCIYSYLWRYIQLTL